MNAIKRGLFVLLTCWAIAGATLARAQNLPIDYSSNLLETISFGGSSTNFEDTLKDDFGFPPLSWTNLTSVPGNGMAVLMDTNPSWVQYPIVVQGGTWTNLTLNHGTVSMWVFLTNSSSGVWSLDPGQRGAFIEAGSYSADASYGWWSLYTEGSHILFSAQDSHGGQTNYLCAPINWSVASNKWIQLTLTYAPNSNATKLYINGALATNGPAMSVVPDTAVISNSFYLGSSGSSNLLHAAIDDIYFWNCPLDAATINDFFQSGYANFFLNPNTIGWVPGEAIASAPFYTTNNCRAIAGAGFLQFVGTAPNWSSAGQVWMTNISAAAGPGGSTTIYFSVMGGSNGLAYDVYATAGLAGSGITNSAWSWMGQVYAGGRYALGSLPNTSAYLVLGTPTDQDGDGLCDSYELLISHSSPTDPGSDLPQGWLWAYFGDFNHSSTDLDSQGANTLLYDYANGLDPNVVSFSVSVTNQFVNARLVPLQAGISAGVPASMAVLVDSTNYAAANWMGYSTNLAASLGGAEGWHDIYVGMRGRPINSQQTWQHARVKLDLTPPLLVITNPVSATVTQPMIQVQGYCNEALASLAYDLSNASGVVTGQQALVTGSYYDTNTWEFTTCAIQAFDVPITIGPNTFTFYATDLAGNLTATNFTYTLDYSSKTNPPAIGLYWPQDGAMVSGDTIAWRGKVDDYTATVTAEVTDPSGATSQYPALVERNGNFWVENLALSGTNGGTNFLKLLVLDAAGNSNTASIMVVKSPVTFAIEPVPAEQLNQLTVNVDVTGTMSADDYTVWVNGICATNTGEGTWSAAGVPVPAGGVAVFQARAISNSSTNSGSGGGGATLEDLGNPISSGAIETEEESDKPGRLYVDRYYRKADYSTGWSVRWYDSSGTTISLAGYSRTWHYNLDWRDGAGGGATEGGQDSGEDWYYNDEYSWPASHWPDLAWGTVTEEYPTYQATNACEPPDIEQQHRDTDYRSYYAVHDIYSSEWDLWYSYTNYEYYTEHAESMLMLETGGKGIPGQVDFWTISASSTAVLGELPDWEQPDPQTSPIPPEQIRIRTLGQLDANGQLVVVLPAGGWGANPIVPGSNRLNSAASAVKNSIVSVCQATGFAKTNRYTIGVGEKVDLSFNPDPPGSVKWKTPISGLSGTLTYYDRKATTFTAPGSGGTTTVTVSSGTNSKTIAFSVLEPTNIAYTIIIATNNFEEFKIYNSPNFSGGEAGAKMLVRVCMAPTNVSFHQVWMHEVPLDAINVTGYFTNTNLFTSNPALYLHHNSAKGVDFQLDEDNTWVDQCWQSSLPQPWSSGSYTWNIPWDWGLKSGGTIVPKYMTNGWQQVFSLDTNGTVRITKFDKNWVQRTTNNIITVTNMPYLP